MTASGKFRDRAWLNRLKLAHWVEVIERRLRHHIATKLHLPIRHGEAFSYPVHALPGAPGQFPKPIPKLLWIFWAQGFDQAPDVVRACRASWHRHNPDWEVRELDLGTISQYVTLPGYADPSRMTLAAFGDVLRVHLLEAHGGVWADATVFCSKPLQDWLPPLTQSGFFAFTNPRRGRLIASWFLAAEPNNPIVISWRILLDRYWSTTRSAHEYFWVHRLFGQAISYSREARCLWSAMPRLDASGPHTLQRSLSLDTIPAQLQIALRANLFAVHKLTWKIPVGQEPRFALLLHLLEQEREDI